MSKKPTLNPVLRPFWQTQARNKILYGGRASSKCLGIGTKVMMSNGTIKKVEDVVIGDLVMGSDGNPRKVLHTTRGYSNLYLVKQSFGMDYIVNEEHILSIKKSESCKNDKGLMPSGNYRRPNGRYPNIPDILNISVKEYLDLSPRMKNSFKGYRSHFSFSKKDLKIEPYLLGVWLGDGNKSILAITTEDREIKEYIYNIAESNGLGVNVSNKPNNSASTYRIFNKSRKPFELWESFRHYNLVAEQYKDRERFTAPASKKHIPNDYLTASRDQRLELLAGIIDTDGEYQKEKHTMLITQKDEALAYDFLKLASWLGFPSTIRKINTTWTYNGVKKTGSAFQISVSGRIHEIPTKLSRKKAPYRDIKRNKSGGSSVLKVESIGYGEYAGFSIDGDHLFCLEDGTVTHNSWDTAGFAIYLANKYNLRFLCVRQIQNKIEQSVYALLKIQIERFGLKDNFKITDNKIINKRTGSEFMFYGLWRHIDEIKSIESVDVLWSEESHALTEGQWEILEPTIRKEGSECWLIFNPALVSDFVWQNFVINPPKNTLVRKINYTENGFLSRTALEVIESKKERDPDTFPHVYLGEPRQDNDDSVIKASWVNACIDAHLKIPEFDTSGGSFLGFDIADSGADKCATVSRKGGVAFKCSEWKGQEDELLKSCAKAYNTAREDDAKIIYDAIGVGATAGSKFKELGWSKYEKFVAGGAVLFPDKLYAPKITNKDMFCNLKSQAWWGVADRMRITYQVIMAISNNTPIPKYSKDDLISISSDIDNLEKLKMELSSPLRVFDNHGKVMVEKKEDMLKRGLPSPNIADAFIMAFAPTNMGMKISRKAIGAFSR